MTSPSGSVPVPVGSGSASLSVSPSACSSLSASPSPAASLSPRLWHSPSLPSSPRPFRPPMPYDKPIASGRCAFSELPDELVEQILLTLNLGDLTRCFRISKYVHGLMTHSAPITLRHRLLSSSLRLNPAAVRARRDMLEQRPLTSAEMLATLSDRLDRFASLRPLGSSSVKLEDRKGSLYEYLEGVLLRSISVDGARSHQMAVYDLRDLVADPAGAAAETEAEEAGEGEAVVLDEQQDAQTSASASASGSAPVVATSTTAVENDEAQMVVDMALAADWSDEDWIDVDDVDGDQSSDDDDDDENEDGSDGNDSESVADSNDSSDEDEDADMAGGDDDESDLDGDPIVPGMFDIVFESDKPPSPIGSTGSNITDPNEAGLRRVHSCDFKVRELAVDPGQDLLVLVSSRATHTFSTIFIHLLSLSTFEPHPGAASPILQWPSPILSTTDMILDFQICDDSLFILLKARGQLNLLTGWNWRRSKQIMTLSSRPAMAFCSFVLLSASSFVIPAARVSDNDDVTFHLELYAFPEGDIPDKPYTATHVATIDLPAVDRIMGMSARTDPPPRHSFPEHPHRAPPPFAPHPKSGIAIFTFECFPSIPTTHYALFILKTTLLRYMPAPTSPLLKMPFSKPCPVIPWERIAPYCRLFGPNLDRPNWVCYVYQYRFVTIERRVQHLNLRTYVVLYDFDPIRVRKERFARMSKLNLTDMPEDLSVLEDEVDGVQLVLNSTTSDPNHYLVTESPVVTGQNLPYVRTSRPLRDTSRSTKPVPLIDSERILIVRDASRPDGRHDVDVMQF